MNDALSIDEFAGLRQDCLRTLLGHCSQTLCGFLLDDDQRGAVEKEWRSLWSRSSKAR